MAIQEHGDSSYKFSWGDEDNVALATQLGLSPTTLDITSAPEYVAKAENTAGVPAAMAVAPDGRQFTMTGYYQDKVKFEAAAAFEFDGRYFVITGRKIGVKSKEYQMAEFSGVQHDEITAAVL